VQSSRGVGVERRAREPVVRVARARAGRRGWCGVCNARARAQAQAVRTEARRRISSEHIVADGTTEGEVATDGDGEVHESGGALGAGDDTQVKGAAWARRLCAAKLVGDTHDVLVARVCGARDGEGPGMVRGQGW
jgi:hypothetical protein